MRRTTLLLLLIVTTSLSPLLAGRKTTTLVSATPTTRISREEYINRYKHIAIDHQQRFGIPASITMAQGILESDNGNSRLSRASNNHFGIKCKGNWSGRSVRHDDDAPNECFRAYNSVEESYTDHAKFLDESPRYDSLFRFDPTDYRSWARGLKNAGYATAPDYTQRLIKLIEEHTLYELDGTTTKLATTPAPAPRTTATTTNRTASTTERVDPNDFRISATTANGYSLYKSNQKLYVIAREGDSYRSLAKRFSLTPTMLCNYNDIADRDATLRSGEVVYIERKGDKWLGESPTHRVMADETLHSLSQLYGVQERALRKYNKIKIGEPEVGFTINLRKR